MIKEKMKTVLDNVFLKIQEIDEDKARVAAFKVVEGKRILQLGAHKKKLKMMVSKEHEILDD